jgi:hypothetical protein
MLPMFEPDYPFAKVVPAHESNVLFPSGHGGVPNHPRGFVIHTPEEPVDNYPGTPYWFQTPNIYGSTQYFVSAQPDPNRSGFTQVYQMVPEAYYCYANGLTAGRTAPPWAEPGSLNWQTNHVEVEGYANSIRDTLNVGGPQWKSLVHLVKHRAAFWGYPTDKVHIIGHNEVSNEHYDPGVNFPWAEFIRDLNSEEEPPMNRYVALANPEYFRGFKVDGKVNVWTASSVENDLHVPTLAKSILVTVYLREGELDLLDGDGQKAGFCAGRMTTYQVIPGTNPTRDFILSGSAVIDQIECLGYFL